MILRRLDTLGDWTFGQGKGDYAVGLEAIRQNIQCRVLSWMYNCFFAKNDGIDYSSLLDKGQQNNLSYAIKAQILSSYGVVRIQQMSAIYTPRTRNLVVTYSVDTIYGQALSGTITQ